MAINWDSIGHVRSPAPEIASITGLLSAFAENREKQRMAAEARAMQEREFALRQQNIDADNARAAQELQLRRDQEARAAAAAKAKADAERDEEVRKGLPGVTGALAAGEEGRARTLGEPLGIGIDRSPEAKNAPLAQAARGEEFAASMGPPTGGSTSFGRVLDTGPYAGIDTAVERAREIGRSAAAAPTDDEARAERSFQLKLPAGKILDYDPQEQRQAKELRASADATRVSGALGPEMGAAYAERLIKAGMSPEDAAKMAVGRVQHLEDQDNTNKRARMAAARAGAAKSDRKIDDDRQQATAAAALLNQELGRENYKDIVGQYRDTQKMLDNLKSDNAAAQKLALGIWAKQASGPGAVQQAEREEFVNTVGGKTMAIRKAAMAWLDGGKVPPEQLKIFSAAARNIIQRRQVQTLEGIKEGVRDMFATHPNDAFHGYADWGANRVASSILGPVGHGGVRGPGGQKGPVDLKSLDAEADKILGGGK